MQPAKTHKIIIISLFQEDNIWSSITKVEMTLAIEQAQILLFAEQVRYPYTEHAASGLPNPTHLGGKVTI